MKLLVTIVFLLIIKLSFSQDLIITTKGDSLNCKIIKSQSDKVFLSYKNKNEIRDTLLSKSFIKYSQYDFYKLNLDSLYKLGVKRVYPRFKLSVNVGGSYQFFNIGAYEQQIIKDYLDGLKTGYNFGADISWFLSKPLGIGLIYNNFKTHSASTSFIITQQDGSFIQKNSKTDLVINYFGPTFCTRILSSNHKNAILFDMSVGYIDYVENDEVLIKTKITGQTIGLIINSGIDISFSKYISLGFMISYMYGTISQYERKNGYNVEKIKLSYKEEYINVSRIDFSIGLRYNK